jgi:hypothetical protein
MADDEKHDRTMLGAQNLAGSTECHTFGVHTIVLGAQIFAGNFADATERHTLGAQITMLGAQNLTGCTERYMPGAQNSADSSERYMQGAQNFADPTVRHTLDALNTLLGTQNLAVPTEHRTLGAQTTILGAQISTGSTEHHTLGAHTIRLGAQNITLVQELARGAQTIADSLVAQNTTLSQNLARGAQTIADTLVAQNIALGAQTYVDSPEGHTLAARNTSLYAQLIVGTVDRCQPDLTGVKAKDVPGAQTIVDTLVAQNITLGAQTHVDSPEGRTLAAQNSLYVQLIAGTVDKCQSDLTGIKTDTVRQPDLTGVSAEDIAGDTARQPDLTGGRAEEVKK